MPLCSMRFLLRLQETKAQTWPVGVTHSSDLPDVALPSALRGWTLGDPGDCRRVAGGHRLKEGPAACAWRSFSRCSASGAILGSRPAVLPWPVPRAFTQGTLPPPPPVSTGTDSTAATDSGDSSIRPSLKQVGRSALVARGEGRPEKGHPGWARLWLSCLQAGRPAFPTMKW